MGKAGEVMFGGFANDPIASFEREHLSAFDKEDRSKNAQWTGGSGKGVEEAVRIFEQSDQLVSVGKENVLAVRFECVKFEGKIVDDLKTVAVKFVNIARFSRIGLQYAGRRMVIALREKIIDDAGIYGADMEGGRADEKNLILAYHSGAPACQ